MVGELSEFVHEDGCAWIETSAAKLVGLLPFFHPLERCVDGHGVTMPQPEVSFQPSDDFAGLHFRFEQTFVLGKLPEVLGRFACLSLDVVDICLK